MSLRRKSRGSNKALFLVAACEGVGYALGQVRAIRLGFRDRNTTFLRMFVA